MKDKQITTFLQLRDKALREMDLDYARERMPDASEEVMLITMHKARCHVTSMEPALVCESVQWLESRGYSAEIRVNGHERPKIH